MGKAGSVTTARRYIEIAISRIETQADAEVTVGLLKCIITLLTPRPLQSDWERSMTQAVLRGRRQMKKEQVKINKGVREHIARLKAEIEKREAAAATARINKGIAAKLKILRAERAAKRKR